MPKQGHQSTSESEIKNKTVSRNFLLTISTGLLILLVALIFLIPSSASMKKQTTVSIGDNVIKSEISDSEEERTTGLAGRKSLSRNAGMIFVFDQANKHTFWMKGMTFPIDIIWINDGKVVDITRHASPETGDSQSLTIYEPEKPAKYVLEVNANFTVDNGVKVGDIAKSSIFK